MNSKKWLTEEYQGYFNEVKKAVIALYKENEGKDLPHFTPHGEEHCKAVEELIYQITDSPKVDPLIAFSDKERFCLVASAWLHDIGMLPTVYRQVYDHKIAPSPSLIREKHHKTSAKFIVEKYRSCGLKEEDIEAVAQICYFHRKKKNIKECKREFIVGFDKSKNVLRLRLLAAYLRLADSLHVDISRAPNPNYNICLTYSIPPDSKVHWVKSQIVDGIKIDCEKKLITVAFKTPRFDPSKPSKQPYGFEDKLNSIIRLVMNSLHEELNSVINVLLDYDITYFRDIIDSRQPDIMSEQMKNDLNELVLNYDIMEHPSASKLLEMTSQTIANIAGYNLTDSQPRKFRNTDALEFEDIKAIVKDEFLGKLYKDVKNTRPCHKGINNLIKSCELIQEHSSTTDEYIEKLQKLYLQYKNTAYEIKKNASSFFKKCILDNDQPEEKFTIILFGYSQSVINALCGFRDAIIDHELPMLLEKMPEGSGDKVEKRYSQRFRFYICEGSPKTQVGSENKLLYHDGSQYALALKRNNFSNLVIIPDIIVDNIIGNEQDRKLLFMVGANGFNQEFFMHSAGHHSIFKIVKQFNKENISSQKIKTILVVSNHKKDRNETIIDERYKDDDTKEANNKRENIESCWFWKRNNKEATRQHIWLPRDEVILSELFDKEIMFFNPREDKIPIDKLDFIISNVKYHPIIDENPEELNKNKNSFHEAINERNYKDQQELKRGAGMGS